MSNVQIKAIQLLARVNPALYPVAATVEVAKAKVISATVAAWIANKETSQESARCLLTIGSDLLEPCGYRAWLNDVVQEMGVSHLPIGSGRQNARDCGGRIGNALTLARKAKLGLATLPDAQLLSMAFPEISRACDEVSAWIETRQQFGDSRPQPLSLTIPFGVDSDWLNE